MSLVNIVAGPDRILVAVDTDVFDQRTSSHAEGSKLLAIPHVNAVLAGRGHLSMVNAAALVMIESTGLDFDVMVDQMPGFLTQAHEALVSSGRLLGDSPGQDIFFAGWSPRHGRMQALHYVLRDGTFVLRREITTACLSPGDCFEGVSPSSSTLSQDMAGIARQQVAWMRKTTSEIGAGGRLIVAELTRDHISISTGEPL